MHILSANCIMCYISQLYRIGKLYKHLSFTYKVIIRVGLPRKSVSLYSSIRLSKCLTGFSPSDKCIKAHCSPSVNNFFVSSAFFFVSSEHHYIGGISRFPFLHMPFFAVLDASRRAVLSDVGEYYPARLPAGGMVVTHKLFHLLRFSQNMKH